MKTNATIPAVGSDKAAPNHPDANLLCMKCGLCCDGSLYEKVPISAEDDFDHLKAFGGRQGAKGKNVPQPCAAQQNRACTIYPYRPKVCAQYRCHLLTQYEEQKIPFQEAESIIGKTIEHSDRVRKALLTATNGIDAPSRQLYQQLANSAFPIKPEIASILLDFAALQIRLNKHFRLNRSLIEKKPI